MSASDSGFSAAWLALREPADHAARNAGITRMVRQTFASTDTIQVCDLGAGTGSSLRALAPHLPADQHWTLLDHDPDLLTAARKQLAAWAEQVDRGTAGGPLHLKHHAKRITIGFQRADLRGDLDAILPGTADLINGSALIDLVSEAWLDRLVTAATHRGAAVLMTLSYGGIERWQPPHDADSAMLAAFNAHQQGSKDFGPALGPRAAEVLSRKLKTAGYEVVLAPSPWQLAAGRDRALMTGLAEGIAAAVAETGRVPPDQIAAWLRARRTATAAEIAHVDLFAIRP